jgi:hypothetical protein
MVRRFATLFSRDQVQMHGRGRSVRRAGRSARPALDCLEERVVLSGPNSTGVAASLILPVRGPIIVHLPPKPNPTGVAAIASEYKALGTAILGKPTSSVQVASDGTGAFQNYHGGVIYWSAATGAHDLYGAILQKWDALGAVKFGYPTTNEQATPDGIGLDSHFQVTTSTLTLRGKQKPQAAIDWTPKYGAHAVTGPIATLFASKGWEQNGEAISYQIDLTATGSAYQYFAKDVIFGFLPYAIDDTAATGAYITDTSSYTDISQGNAGTCWILASIAAMEADGHDLSQLIHYQGNDTYKVQLYVPNNPASRPAGGYSPVTVSVYFDGSRNSADPGYSLTQPSQSWVVVMQRAVIEAVEKWDPTESITNPHGGGAGDALATLTGIASTSVGAQASNVQQQVTTALAAGHDVVFGTSGSATPLVPGHYYAVLSASSQGVTLYNPWGAAETSPTPDPQLVSWSVIAQDGSQFFFD